MGVLEGVMDATRGLWACWYSSKTLIEGVKGCRLDGGYKCVTGCIEGVLMCSSGYIIPVKMLILRGLPITFSIVVISPLAMVTNFPS